VLIAGAAITTWSVVATCGPSFTLNERQQWASLELKAEAVAVQHGEAVTKERSWVRELIEWSSS
jgi:hypothetical protein